MAPDSPSAGARWSAAVALLGYAALAVELIVPVLSEPLPGLLAIVLIGAGVPLTWMGAAQPHWRLLTTIAAAAMIAAGAVALLASGAVTGELAAVAVTIAVTAAAGRFALGNELRCAVDSRWQPAGPARHPVLLLNPASGDGKAAKFDLQGECARRGIEVVVLGPGDDLRTLAEDAAARGADVIGMAGGDGSQAVVAAVAAAHDLPFVCVPSGTRNHFALDLGVDRADLVGSLDAYRAARQGRVDLAEVNGRTFVNNVSLGIYARIIASDAYRDAKLETAATMLPGLLGPDAPPSALRASMPDGREIENPPILLVSNNPYHLTSLDGLGTRPRLDGGLLGVAALALTSPDDISRFIAADARGQLDRFPGWQTAVVPTFEVRADHPVAAGVDGEALELDAPLRFVARPGALTVRIAAHHLGLSPAALHPGWGRSTFLGLARMVRARPSGLVETGGRTVIRG